MSTNLPNFRRGDTWRFLISPPVDPDLGAIIPLTDREVWFTVKPVSSDEDDDTDAVIQHHAAIADLDLVGTKYLFVVPSNLTEIELGKYSADIQLVLPGSPPEVDTLVVDKRFEVTKDITRKTS